MAKANSNQKNLCFILLGLLIAMVSMAEASANAVGEWKLKEVWRENEAEPLSLTRDGTDYIMSIKPQEDENKLRVTIKVGNSMSSTMSILESGEEEDKIQFGWVMATRMMPGTKEKEELEGYITTNFPKLTSLKVKDGEALVLSSDDGARIVCEQEAEVAN